MKDGNEVSLWRHCGCRVCLIQCCVAGGRDQAALDALDEEDDEDIEDDEELLLQRERERNERQECGYWKL